MFIPNSTVISAPVRIQLEHRGVFISLFLPDVTRCDCRICLTLFTKLYESVIDTNCVSVDYPFVKVEAFIVREFKSDERSDLDNIVLFPLTREFEFSIVFRKCVLLVLAWFNGEWQKIQQPTYSGTKH